MKLTIKDAKRAVSHEGLPFVQQTIYAPNVIADRFPPHGRAHELLLTMGDPITRPAYGIYTGGGDIPLINPNRGSDRIRLWERHETGDWQPVERHYFGNIVLDPHHVFSEAGWMWDEAYLRANPKDFIGSVGSPQAVKHAGLYHMAFVATVADPLVNTAEHGPTQYHLEGCTPTNPWSHFALFWATSPDLVNWTRVDFRRDNESRALSSAAVYYEPEPDEINVIDYGHDEEGGYVYRGDNMRLSSFKGIGGVSVDYEDGYFILSGGFWSSYGGPKQFLMRTLAHELRDFEIWSGWQGGAKWLPIDDGRLPQWLNKDRGRGPVWAGPISGIWRAAWPMSDENRYMLVGSNGASNQVIVNLSDSLTIWPDKKIVIQSDVKGFLDGTGFRNQVRYHSLAGASGNLKLYGATQDLGVQTGDPSKHGINECGDGFAGCVIFECNVEVG